MQWRERDGLVDGSMDKAPIDDPARDNESLLSSIRAQYAPEPPPKLNDLR